LGDLAVTSDWHSKG